MTPIEVRRFGVQDLDRDRGLAAEWNALWERSKVVVPTARAEHVVNWARHFAGRRPVDAFVLEQDGAWVGALPLLRGRIARQPWNYWAWGAELMLDPGVAAGRLDRIARALRSVPASAIRLDAVRAERDHWPELRQAIVASGAGCWVTPLYRIGEIALAPGGWDCYLAGRSRNFRRGVRRLRRRAAEAGGVTLRVERPREAGAAERHTRTAFACEQRSWKAEGGSCVADDPRVLAYFLDQARLMAEHDMLEIVFLEHRGETIAFEYCWRAKGVYFTPKVSYDQRHAALAPGRLLMAANLEALFAEGRITRYDFLGPLEPDATRFATGAYQVARVVLLTGGRLSRSALELARWGGPPLLEMVRRARGRRLSSAGNPEQGSMSTSR